MFMEIAKMSGFLSLFCVTVLILDYASCENVIEETIGAVEADLMMTALESDRVNPEIEELLTNLEDMATTADKLKQDGEHRGDPEEIYDDMIKVVADITDAVKNTNHAYKFLKANGLERIVRHSFKINYDKLKTHIIILLKVLFEVAPTTTSSVIPITVVDRLLEIFEKDNLALKAHSLDVLYAWLPENPRVQARVMKTKGFTPFYEQVPKLDTSVIKTLLDLFNSILKEHLRARNDVQRTIVDNDKMKFYLRIGLLEHMSSPLVCNGLLNIFLKTWSYNTDYNDIIVTVFDMIKNIKPFCLKAFRGKMKAKQLFTALQAYVKDTENIEYFESNGLNVTDISLVIEEYVNKLKYSVKDEM